MLQNSSSVPVVRILQEHSQTTVLPDCERTVSYTRGSRMHFCTIWCPAKIGITESEDYRRIWSLASDCTKKPEYKGWLLLSHGPQCPEHAALRCNKKAHSGVTRKHIQELTLSLRHAGFEAVQIPFQTAIRVFRSQNSVLRGLARFIQRNT